MTNEYSYEIMYQYNICSLYKMESGFYAKEEKVFIISNFTFQLSFINYYDHRAALRPKKLRTLGQGDRKKKRFIK